jgi:hypothetical protein
MEIKVYSVDGVTYKPNGFEDSRWLAHKSFTRDQLLARMRALNTVYGSVSLTVLRYGKVIEQLSLSEVKHFVIA